MLDPASDKLHYAGEFHDPRGCTACSLATLSDAGRRANGPTVVTFTDPDGTTTVMQAESVTWNYNTEPFIPEEVWFACTETHPEQALLRKEDAE
jgi:hypothetical protein